MSLFSRLRHVQRSGIEDYFTEIFAHLLSTYPGLCISWLEQYDVLSTGTNYEHINIDTQRTFGALDHHQRSSRPDVVMKLFESMSDDMQTPPTDVIFVESKMGSKEGEDQLKRYAEQLSAIPEARSRILVYITRDYDPKDVDAIVSGLEDSDKPIRFVCARWHEFYRTLEEHRLTSLPDSDLIEEVLLFMQHQGMSQTSRLSAADVVALSGMTRMLAFMQETVAGEVAARLREVSGLRLATRNETLKQLVDQERYFLYTFMGPQFWCGAGFYLGQDDPSDYPWLSVVLEVGPEQPGRDEIIAAMRSFAKDCSQCDAYELDNPTEWSGLDWAVDLREVLAAEDYMAVARAHFLKGLDDVARMREQYPSLPWQTERAGYSCGTALLFL